MDQLSFFDDSSPNSAPPAQTPFLLHDVVFFGVRLLELGQEVTEVHRMLKRSHGLTGIPYEADRLHVSLLRVGERDKLNEEDIEELRRAASRVSFAPFAITFETVLSYDGNGRRDERRAVVFPVADGAAEIIALARDIEARVYRRLRVEGEAPPSPHMTLLRDRARVPLTALDPPFGARVTRFELICSHRSQRTYATLWP
jgi:2'-5' RNA ligase